MNYKTYLKSDEWKQKRAEARRRARGRCKVCGSRALLQTHHKTYRNLGRESQHELVVLCDAHHWACHCFIGDWKRGVREKGWKDLSTYALTMKFVARERTRLLRLKGKEIRQRSILEYMTEKARYRDKVFFGSQGQMAEDLGVSRRTVIRDFKELEAVAKIERVGYFVLFNKRLVAYRVKEDI